VRITRDKYERALKSLPKLRQAEEIVKQWEQAKKQRAQTFATEDVLQIELVDGKYHVTSVERDAQKRLVS
jgi:hypothetical protein